MDLKKNISRRKKKDHSQYSKNYYKSMRKSARKWKNGEKYLNKEQLKKFKWPINMKRGLNPLVITKVKH